MSCVVHLERAVGEVKDVELGEFLSDAQGENSMRLTGWMWLPATTVPFWTAGRDVAERFLLVVAVAGVFPLDMFVAPGRVILLYVP